MMGRPPSQHDEDPVVCGVDPADMLRSCNDIKYCNCSQLIEINYSLKIVERFLAFIVCNFLHIPPIMAIYIDVSYRDLLAAELIHFFFSYSPFIVFE